MTPKHTVNRILVARGNNRIQDGGYIKNREKTHKMVSGQQEMDLLVARGNKGFPIWPTNMK